MVSKDLNICVYPAPIKWDAIKENLDNLEAVVETIHPKTDLLILPETVSTGFPSGKSKEEIKNLIKDYQKYSVDLLAYLSAKKNMAIATSLVTEENGELYNRAFFFEPNGDITTADKRHLFSMAGEHEVFKAGSKRLGIRYRGWNIAMVVCYDVRFPAWCRNVDNEYDLLIAVANWPDVRIGAWNALVNARAIENLSYVAAENCKGEDTKGFKYDGSSHIRDYKGHDISVGSNDSPLLYATLSNSSLSEFRKKFPAYKDADSFRLL